MKWGEMFKVEISEWGVLIGIGPVLVVVVAVIIIAVVVVQIRRRGWKFWQKYEVVEGEIPIAGLGKVTIRPNHETMRIAYQAWIELATRKAALPLDEEHDVLVEVYDSWYEVFGILRDLVKEIPAYRLRHSEDAQNLVKVMVEVLNKGLRPHLTEWQAKFRKWYTGEKDKEENAKLSPQEIQKRYAQYEELVKDVKRVNQIIVNYADWLRRIAGCDE